jgi:hypothetical protein
MGGGTKGLCQVSISAFLPNHDRSPIATAEFGVMCPRKGELITGLEFFELLCPDDRFCAQLGRAVLAAGRSRVRLSGISLLFTQRRHHQGTLGTLIQYCKKDTLLTRMIPALGMLRDQRNYLNHNIHALCQI